MNFILISLGIIILIIYCSPLFSSKLNIGNIFGISVALALTLTGAFFDSIMLLFRENIVIKTLVSTILILSILFLTAFIITLIKVLSPIKNKPTNEKVVIVLGCRVKGYKPSKALYKRCIAAYNYLIINNDAIAILSGGQGKDECISEAQCMFNILTQKGIDSSRLIIEDKSTSTAENIINSKQIIDKNKLSNTVVIATSEYHIFRAIQLAKAHNLTACSLPAKTIPVLRIPYFTREVFAIWWNKIIKK